MHAFGGRQFVRFRTPVEKLTRYYYVADPDMGFDIRKNVTQKTHTFAHGTYPIFSDYYGCFDKEKPVPDKYILMIGDSFVWGYTPYEHKWGTRLEEILDRRVVKCGVSASGTAQQLMKANRTIERVGHTPQIIILGYFYKDLHDDFAFPSETVIDGYKVSRVKKIDLKNGEIGHFTDDELRSHIKNRPRAERSLRSLISANSVVANILWKKIRGTSTHAAFRDIIGDIRDRYSVDLYGLRDDRVRWAGEVWRRHLQNILKLKTFARRIGAELVVFLIPKSEGYDYRDMKLFLRKHDILHLDFSTGMYRIAGSPGNLKDLYWRYDPHWNNWGNEAAALLSAEYLVRRGLTGDVSGGRAGTLAALIANLGQTVKNAR